MMTVLRGGYFLYGYLREGVFYRRAVSQATIFRVQFS